MITPSHPSDEIVAAAWIGSIPGLTPDMVGEQLPPDTEPDGSAAAWIQTGFITVAVVGGTPSADLPVHQPVLSVEGWATVPGSDDPPWLMARALLSAVLQATWDRQHIPRLLAITADDVTYPSARVQTAYAPTTPRRAPGDAGDYAHCQMDLALSWITVSDVLA